MKFATSAVLATVLMLAGCGLPNESRFTPLSRDQVPDALSATSTSAPTTTVPVEIEAPPTTVTEVLYDLVEFYFVSANRVVRSERLIVSPATPTQVVETLLRGLDSAAQTAGLRSALPRGINATVEVRRGIARVAAIAPFLSELEPLDQRLAIAQLVLTLTRRPGIGQVIFVVDGAEISVPRGGGDLTVTGTPVTYDDYLAVLSTRD